MWIHPHCLALNLLTIYVGDGWSALEMVIHTNNQEGLCMLVDVGADLNHHFQGEAVQLGCPYML